MKKSLAFFQNFCYNNYIIKKKRKDYMAKGWTKIETIYSLKNSPETLAERRRKTKLFNKMMATTPTLTASELKKRSNELYNKKKAEEDNLLQAYEDKRLKSEKAIKQAIQIKKERAKKRQQNSAKQDTEKVSVKSETMDNPV